MGSLASFSTSGARRNRIESGAAERMATRHAPQREPEAAPGAVFLDGRDRVVGAGRFEPARAAGERRQQQLISANDDGRRRARSGTSTTSRRGASSARQENQRGRRRMARARDRRCAIATTSRARGPSCGARRRNISRNRRFARLRSTAPPTRREAMMPSRSASRPFGLPSRVTKPARHATAAGFDGHEFRPRAQPRVAAKSSEPWPAELRLARGNRQALAAFGAAPLENDAAVLRAHPHPEPVSSTAAAAIWLKRALHGTPGLGDSPDGETRIVATRQKTCQFGRLVCIRDRCGRFAGFRRCARPRRRKFSTPVEKPVEISGFSILMSCKLLKIKTL